MYSILRTKKIKARININQAIEHSFRLRHQKNIDPEKTKNNIILFNSLGADLTQVSDFQNKLIEHYQSIGVKEKKDNVLMMEFVITASPAFFQNKNDQEIKVWYESQLDFFKSEYGDQLKLGVLHLDESTPHIHFMIGTEQKSIKKYKNQKGEFAKETCSLNAKRYNPEYLRGLQDRFAEHNKPFGLSRGKPSPGRIHKPVKQYYEDLKRHQQELTKELEKVEKLNKFKDAYPKMKEEILKSHQAIYDLFDIIEGKELSELEIEKVTELSSRWNKKPSTDNKNKI